jgi:hypothetical protein
MLGGSIENIDVFRWGDAKKFDGAANGLDQRLATLEIQRAAVNGAATLKRLTF